MWRGTVLAESADVIHRDGACYFPAEAVRWQRLRPRRKRSWCPWKGVARYFDVEVGGVVGAASAWSYDHPWPSARALRRAVAFGPPVRLEEGGRADDR
ncbi:DUF427 domain-containing protein [Catellatospora sp. KI3]|uniref:DUF427 domain-containing protein n=1 Tax=Catellatospora sp. KI3 TaxID=3041620 RepID=UPI0024825F79|nr:DUF427 domain-containing protein [Catellatospora sp. KI3]MDI1460706.1 DUF427 domain-containing protein [Catellatospora sp. KI3]